MQTMSNWQRLLLALCIGALVPLGLAPFDYTWLGFIGIGLWPWLFNNSMQSTKPSKPFLLGWSYGSGFFLCGVSWVFVSIYQYSNAGLIGASLATLGLSVSLGLFFAIMGSLYQRFAIFHATLFGFAGIWVAFEWIRSWAFTGFPWAYVGYSAESSSIFHGFIPLIGIYGCTWVIAWWSSAGIQLITQWKNLANSQKCIHGCSIILVLAVGIGSQSFQWTTQDQQTMKVALVQGNVPQKDKWNPLKAQAISETYRRASIDALRNKADLIVWPEAAVPYLYNDSLAYLELMRKSIEEYQSNADQSSYSPRLITGVLSDLTWPEVKNSVVLLGSSADTDQLYHKQKLVPFGEYLPFAEQVVRVFPFLEIFKHGITSGSANQKAFQVNSFLISNFICYEIAFPQFVYKNSKDTDILLTISNDGWFGNSHGPEQHFQMAKFRAIELGKPVIRATNTGITAAINQYGIVEKRLPKGVQKYLLADVHKAKGQTPYSRIGPNVILLIIFGLTVIAFLGQRLFRKGK